MVIDRLQHMQREIELKRTQLTDRSTADRTDSRDDVQVNVAAGQNQGAILWPNDS